MTAVVTLTPSAAVDRTYRLGQLHRGRVNRASAVHSELSGKGVNVAAALAAAGTRVSAVLAIGEDVRHLRSSCPIDSQLAVVPTECPTRINITIAEDTSITKLNEAPATTSSATWVQVIERTLSEIERISADWLVVAGSLPRNEEAGTLVPVAELFTEAVALGARVAVDTADEALRHICRDLSAVSLLKPNSHELATLVGRPLRTYGEVTAAARELIAAGSDTVYVSMGADGGLALTATEVWHATALAEVVNTVGAGDCALAGFISGMTRSDLPTHDHSTRALTDMPRGGLGRVGARSVISAGLERATAWGALATTRVTTVLTDLEGAPEVQVRRDPDPETVLSDPATAPEYPVTEPGCPGATSQGGR